MSNCDSYDAIIIGAGPAGGYASYCIAKAGYKVLLVEKSHFPRHKVCGSCLNQVALKELSTIQNLDHNLISDAPEISQIELALPGIVKCFDFSPGLAIERSSLDMAIVGAAQDSGVDFLSGTKATVQKADGQLRKVLLSTDNNTEEVEARLVICADGLNGQSLNNLKEFDFHVKADSLIGVGCIVDNEFGYHEKGKIYMASGDGGYVGAVVLQSGKLDIAAAIDPVRAKELGGPSNLCKSILLSCGYEAFEKLDKLPFKGTISLTRRRQKIADNRLLVIGDAASYIEPFTGEGIAWALGSARAAAELACDALAQKDWHNQIENAWLTSHKELVQNRQKTAKFFSWILRHPSLFRPLVATMDNNPWMVNRVNDYINSK